MLKVWNEKTIAAEIEKQIHVILTEKALPVRKLDSRDRLSDSLGLSSLDLAILVSELELSFGTDPFAQLVPITDIRTVGDLANAYRLALQPAEKQKAEADDLSQAADRARRRVTRRET
jgi:acyl carrier protein